MINAFCIYAAVSLAAIVCFSLREFRMLQLNSYKTPKHMIYMMKNFKRYILPGILLAVNFGLWYVDAWSDLLAVLCAANFIIIIMNLPKSHICIAKTKYALITFFTIIAIFFALAVYYSRARSGEKITEPFCWQMPYFLVNSALYITPVLIPLSNLIARAANHRTEQIKEKL